MNRSKLNIFIVIYFGLMFILPRSLRSQTSPNFDFSLGVDYSAAEHMLDYFDHRTGNTKYVSELRGNQLADFMQIWPRKIVTPGADQL